jgi:DNA-binding NtrC family response regulator
MTALKNYPWLGNIRELQNAIERLCVTCDLKIDEELVADTLVEDACDNLQGTERIDCMRKKHIFEVLKQCGNNKKLAAEKLGISRTTLWRELKANNQPAG